MPLTRGPTMKKMLTLSLALIAVNAAAQTPATVSFWYESGQSRSSNKR